MLFPRHRKLRGPRFWRRLASKLVAALGAALPTLPANRIGVASGTLTCSEFVSRGAYRRTNPFPWPGRMSHVCNSWPGVAWPRPHGAVADVDGVNGSHRRALARPLLKAWTPAFPYSEGRIDNMHGRYPSLPVRWSSRAWWICHATGCQRPSVTPARRNRPMYGRHGGPSKQTHSDPPMARRTPSPPRGRWFCQHGEPDESGTPHRRR